MIMKNNAKNVKNKRHAKKEDNENQQREKKFDKKKYRLQKYSNKYKIGQWEEKRKKAVLHEYYKELKKDQQNPSQNPLDSSNVSNTDKITSNPKKRSYAFHKAKQEYQRKQEEKKKMIQDVIRVKNEREEALKKYKQKKLCNFKMLSKRTKKGQPVMKDRAEMLLEKIQQSLM